MATDDYTTITSPDPRSGLLTAEQLQARRAIAVALATRNRPYPKTIGEGLTALGEGIGEGMYNRDVARAEAAQIAHDAALIRPPSGAVPPAVPSVSPAVPRAPVGQTSLEGGPTEQGPATQESATQAYAMVHPDTTEKAQSLLPWKQIPEKPDMTVDEFNQRTARNESGGEKDPYRAIGKEVSRTGDRGYGKYQVMGENIPVWTRQYLGKAMTPQEFLLDDKAQDQLAKAKGGEYLAKYGPNGAAAAWFAGERGSQDASRPNLQKWVADYVMKFNRPPPGEERDQIAASAARAPIDPENAAPVRVASLGGGAPTPDTAPDQTREAVTQSALAQQGVRPPQQQVAQAQPLPTAPTQAQQLPTLPPKVVGPQVPAYPAYGAKPTPPQPTPDMIQYYRAQFDPYASAGARASAKQTYDQMKADQDAKYARDYKFWEENYLKETTHNVTLPKQQEDLTAAHQQNLERLQKTITGETGAQLDDPNIGTPQSRQRTGIPRLPPKPANMTDEKWQELQGPSVSSAVDAVKRASPMFEDAIRTIHFARDHPGKERGLGLTGIVMRNVPQSPELAFDLVNKQMGGKTFLAAYDTLKGGGQISNVEGEKAQQSQARLDPRQGKDDYDAALKDLEYQLRRDHELAQRKVNMPVTAWRQPGDNHSYAPDINQLGTRGGKRVKYIGGDPAEDRSYQALQ